MKFVSWNVNGLRAVMGKGFLDYFKDQDADVFCLQEIKLSEGQINFTPEGYFCYFNYAQKKGYSGTALFSKIKPINVSFGWDDEGRICCAEYHDYFVVCVYTPNSQDELKRLDFRMDWDEKFRSFISNLDKTKPVFVCGDLNVAHTPIDIKNPKTNIHNAGFTQEERDSFSKTLSLGFVDSFRYFYPNLKDAYSWWSYRFKAREKNAGWRIDYWLVSERFCSNLVAAGIDSQILGSDHAPVYVIVK